MKKWIPIGIIVLLWGAICIKTYVGGTYLLGWDNLAPELRLGINISRAFSAAWQEYQGLGLLGGMGHAADLTRQILLWIASFIVPTDLIRWGWTLLMLLAGPLGVYALGIRLFQPSFVALVGAVFYLLNPVTIQVFNVPFETFVSFYGFVPWMLWGSLTYLRDGKRSSLITLLVILLLGTSAFVVQTLFVVFVIVLVLFSLEYLLRYGDLTRLFKLWGVVTAVNLFWLLPVLWFGITSTSVNVNAKMNLLATEEVELMNVAYGNIGDVVGLQGWWLQNTDVDTSGTMILLMENWTQWLSNDKVKLVGIIIFGFVGLGLLGFFNKNVKRNLGWSWIVLLLLILTMLARRLEIFSTLYDLISQNIPLFGQMFRASYTKWSIPLILVMSVGLMSIVGLINRHTKIAAWGIGLILVGMTTYTALPVFYEGIVGERMRVNFSQKYFDLYKHFETAEMGRIAKLPAYAVWGWQYHDWGYRGSGFLWYGIEQPILDRAFDVWSPYNEGFYNEFSTALYGGKQGDVVHVLDKYDVRYVLLDESMIVPGQDKEILRIEETNALAQELGWNEKFHESFLTVWDTGIVGGAQFVSAPESYTWAEGDTSKVRLDPLYLEVGTYVTRGGNDSAPNVTYPFAGMMREEILNVHYGDNKITLSSDHSPIIAQGSELVIPGWKVGDIVRIEYENGEAVPAYTVNGLPGPRFLGVEKPEEGKSYIVARVSEGEEWREYLENREYRIEKSDIEIEVRGEPFVYDFGKVGAGTIGNCDVLKRGSATKSDGATYTADERGGVCDYVVMSELDTRLPYLMRMQGENREGRSVKFYLYNTGSKRNDIEYLLGKSTFDQTFSLLPWAWDGYYTLNIETRSFGQKTENVLRPVEARWFPLTQIAGAKIVSGTVSVQENNLKIIGVEKTGTWLYRVRVEGQGLLRLSQGYDEGWISRGLEHVKVDGWANGWIVEGDGANEIVIFYWPQLLEYLGFALLGVTIWIVVKSKKHED